jgi:hypothetical protein
MVTILIHSLDASKGETIIPTFGLHSVRNRCPILIIKVEFTAVTMLVNKVCVLSHHILLQQHNFRNIDPTV